MYMQKLIAVLIQWAVFFGVTGGLVDVTREIAREAGHAHSIGLITLRKLNRALKAFRRNPTRIRQWQPFGLNRKSVTPNSSRDELFVPSNEKPC
jgi:hypothetical protein